MSGAIAGSSVAAETGKGKIILLKAKGKESSQVPFFYNSRINPVFLYLLQQNFPKQHVDLNKYTAYLLPSLNASLLVFFSIKKIKEQAFRLFKNNIKVLLAHRREPFLGL